MAFEWKIVPAFGGGIVVSGHPAFLDDDQWTWANGWRPEDGTARTACAAAQVIAGATYVPTGEAAMGVVADAVIVGGWKALVPTRNTTTSAVRLWSIDFGTAAATEKTASGTPPDALYTAATTVDGPALIPCRMNTTQVLALGQGTRSLGLYDGTNLSRVNIASTTARYACVTQGRVILAYLDSSSDLTIAISDANSATTWTPAVSNSADQVTLDGVGMIVGIEATRDGALVVGENRVWALRATGGIPPFAVTILHDGGSGTYIRRQHIVATAFGTVYVAGGLLWLDGTPVPAWTKVAKILNDVEFTGTARIPKLLYHTDRGSLIYPLPDARWELHLATGTWTRTAWEATPIDHGMARPATTQCRYMFVTSAGNLYVESADDTSAGGTVVSSGFVDTKDFWFGAPALEHYIDRIRVDWEPLSNATTNSITVSAYSRADFSPSTAGSVYLKSDLTSKFVSQGTLTAGASELPVRLRGKYTRFRFTQTSGQVRIRGFSIRWSPASDKLRTG